LEPLIFTHEDFVRVRIRTGTFLDPHLPKGIFRWPGYQSSSGYSLSAQDAVLLNKIFLDDTVLQGIAGTGKPRTRSEGEVLWDARRILRKKE
jgi:hypothetical protein